MSIRRRLQLLTISNVASWAIITVLVTAVEHPTQGLLGRFDAYGVGFDNAMKLARHFIAGYGSKQGPQAAAPLPPEGVRPLGSDPARAQGAK